MVKNNWKRRMKHIHKQKLKILSTQTDMNAELGWLQSLTLAQDNMCEYFKIIDCDGIAMIPAKGCFFVLAKTIIEFSGKSPKWLDEVLLTTELCNKTRIKVNLETSFENSKGERFATCVHEMCAIDHESRSVRMLSTTSLPEDIEVTKDQSLEFSKFDGDGLEFECETIRRVDLTNIDMYRHVNNLEYVKFMMSMLSVDFMDSVKISKFEIHYIAESRFEDDLCIKQYKGDDRIVFMIYNGDRLVNRGIVYFDNK